MSIYGTLKMISMFFINGYFCSKNTQNPSSRDEMNACYLLSISGSDPGKLHSFKDAGLEAL